MTPEDTSRIVDAIDRLRISIYNQLDWIFAAILLAGLMSGCPRMIATPLLPPLTYEIGTPPLPPPNPHVQYWHTQYVPGPQGVLPVEVFAPGLLILAGCSDQPSRFHNHGTPGKTHLKAEPKMFTVDTDKGNDFTLLRQSDDSVKVLQRGGNGTTVLSPDLPVKKPAPKPKLIDMGIMGNVLEHPGRDHHRCAELDLNNPIPPECVTPHYTIGRFRPRNGQCPVCGTMAKPYKPDLKEYSGMCLPCTSPNGVCFSNCLPYTEDDLPTSRRIDCAHCNTTFRQWAEGKEPKR